MHRMRRHRLTSYRMWIRDYAGGLCDLHTYVCTECTSHEPPAVCCELSLVGLEIMICLDLLDTRLLPR